ncbi:MAG TPA: hypothetical protein DIW53_11515 [Achromobacter sp.]|nr:hypothetical protein [Achromobacter sp.]
MTRSRIMAFFLSLLAAPAGAGVIYDNHGLVVDITTGGQRDWNTGQRQNTRSTTISFQGNKLCGKDVGKLLYPDGRNMAVNAFFCAANARALETDAVLAYFTSSSADAALAHLQVVNGSLRVNRLALSRQPDRDKPSGTRFEDARLPGWTRVETAWAETVMIRHASLAPAQLSVKPGGSAPGATGAGATRPGVINLGAGKLLDVDGDVVYLAIPPGRDVVVVEPATRIKDAQGDMRIVPEVVKFVDTPLAFRAVRLSTGQELARLDVKDTCAALPAMEFNQPDPLYPSSARRDVLFDDVPAWRAATLQLTQTTGRATLQLKPGVTLPTKPNCKRG